MTRRAAAAGVLAAVVALTLSPSRAEAVANDQPEPLVTVGEWVDGEIECDVVTVRQTREVTITPYVFDDALGEWVLDPSAATVEFDDRIRELALDEIVPCSLPPQPPDLVVPGDWVDGQIECGAATVEQTRTVTTTPYVEGDGIWILDVDSATSTTETRTRDLAPEEIRPCPEVSTTAPSTTVPSDDQTLTTVVLTPADEPDPLVLPDAGPAPTAAAELPSTGRSESLTVALATFLTIVGASILLMTRRGRALD